MPEAAAVIWAVDTAAADQVIRADTAADQVIRADTAVVDMEADTTVVGHITQVGMAAITADMAADIMAAD